MDDRCDCVEKGECIFVSQLADRFRQRLRSEGASRNDHVIPIRWRQSRNLAALQFDHWMVAQCARDGREKPSRSTARAPPAGTWLASAACMISEPNLRISA